MCVLIALRQFEATKGIVIVQLSVFVWLLCNVNQALGIQMLINYSINGICLTSLTCVKCGVRSTLCWKVWNISGPT